MISKNQFKDHFIEQFEKWFENFQAKEYKTCNEISKTHIKLCREILQNKLWDNAEENNLAYITGVLFRGLDEFIKLAELTRDRKWHLDNKRTESVWRLMWNCIERFEFCSSYFVSNEFIWIKKKLTELKKDFIKHFGYGVYVSPEILIKYEICSICKKDNRACMHVNGNLYNGEMCYSVPQDIQMQSVSLVRVPRDPRCRIWPWNMTEERTFTTAIMILFRIDDWLSDKTDEL